MPKREVKGIEVSARTRAFSRTKREAYGGCRHSRRRIKHAEDCKHDRKRVYQTWNAETNSWDKSA